MRVASYSTNQLLTVFGGGYVAEQHVDRTHSYLPPSEPREVIVDFGAVLKALRAALSLR